MNQTLSWGAEVKEGKTKNLQIMVIHVATETGKTRPKHTDQLQGDHVVGEEVRVAHCCCRTEALLPPLLETQVDDKETQWEKEDEVGDEHRCHGESGCSGF